MKKEKINTKLIEDFIENSGLTKQEFCKNCGISKSTLSDVLNQKRKMRLRTLFKICKYTKIKSDDLLYNNSSA